MTSEHQFWTAPSHWPVRIAGNQMDQRRKTLYSGSVSNDMHASVSSVSQQRFDLHNSESWWFKDIAPVDGVWYTMVSIFITACNYEAERGSLDILQVLKVYKASKGFSYLIANWDKLRSILKCNWAESGVWPRQVKLIIWWTNLSILQRVVTSCD